MVYFPLAGILVRCWCSVWQRVKILKRGVEKGRLFNTDAIAGGAQGDKRQPGQHLE